MCVCVCVCVFVCVQGVLDNDDMTSVKSYKRLRRGLRKMMIQDPWSKRCCLSTSNPKGQSALSAIAFIMDGRTDGQKSLVAYRKLYILLEKGGKRAMVGRGDRGVRGRREGKGAALPIIIPFNPIL